MGFDTLSGRFWHAQEFECSRLISLATAIGMGETAVVTADGSSQVLPATVTSTIGCGEPDGPGGRDSTHCAGERLRP